MKVSTLDEIKAMTAEERAKLNPIEASAHSLTVLGTSLLRAMENDSVEGFLTAVKILEDVTVNLITIRQSVVEQAAARLLSGAGKPPAQA